MDWEQVLLRINKEQEALLIETITTATPDKLMKYQGAYHAFEQMKQLIIEVSSKDDD